MGTFSYNDNSIEGDVYIQRLSTYVKRNEESLANGLLCFSRNRSTNLKVKPLRLSFTMHHLYYTSERIESSPLGIDVGPLNIKLDNPNHEPTFISFMANNARSSKHFDSDTRSISSINSMKSIVSSASVYWRSFAFSKDPKVINKDIKYLYSSFTKIPCLILSPKTKINCITSYEEYPCDTSVPIKMFKNLQVLEIVDYEPNEIFGWHILSEQLRILIIRNSKIDNIGDFLFNLVIDDESGRSSFNSHKQPRKFNEFSHNTAIQSVPTSSEDSFGPPPHDIAEHPLSNHINNNNAFRYPKRERASTTGGAGSLPKDMFLAEPLSKEHHSTVSPFSKDYQTLPDSKWSFLKQLTVSETSITRIPSFIFKPLSNLVKLNLSNNLLEEIPHGLDQLVNIKYLNFADNYITNLENLPRNLKYLSALNFNNNKLSDLSGLEHLHSLEKIDLRRNSLESLESLKPIVLQFIKSLQKFNNVYLSSNSLPKTYRSDLFNLFNGVKYKNNMKIDDSRPGYFESALLLDAESAFKNLEKYFGKADEGLDVPKQPEVLTSSKSEANKLEATSSNKEVTPRNSIIESTGKASTIRPKQEASTIRPKQEVYTLVPKLEISTLVPKQEISTLVPRQEISTLVPKQETSKSNRRDSTNHGLRSNLKSLDSTKLDDSFTSEETNTFLTSSISRSAPTRAPGHTRSHTLDTLMEPFQATKINQENDEYSGIGKRRYDLSHTILTTSPIVQCDTSFSQKSPSSPLSINQNVTNKYEISTSNLSKPAVVSVNINGTNSPLASSPTTLRKSSTLSQLDLESVNTTAPNILTPIQVTARMST